MDDMFLYVFIKVVDDEISATGASSYENDSAEIYFNGDNSKGDAYDGIDDVQTRIEYQDGSDASLYDLASGNVAISCMAAIGDWEALEGDAFGYTIEAAYALSVFQNDTLDMFVLENDSDPDADSLMIQSVNTSLTAGEAWFSAPVLIGETAMYPSRLLAADLDGDGDRDLVVTDEDRLAWNENIDGNGQLGTQKVLYPYLPSIDCIDTGDLDGDSCEDLFIYHEWDENCGDTFRHGYYRFDYDVRTREFERTELNDNGVTKTVVKDFDGDGHPDLLTGARGVDIEWMWWTPGGIRLHLNPQGNGHLEETVITDRYNIDDIFGEDLDQDGDLDIITLRYEFQENSPWLIFVEWYENADDLGNFALADTLLVESESGLIDLKVIDFDNDGDPDILFKREMEIIWLENTRESEIFETEHVLNIAPIPVSAEFQLVDLDLDRDYDVIINTLTPNGGLDKLVWYENTGGLIDFGPAKVISEYYPHIFTDMDGDGDPDMVYSPGTQIYLLRNELTPDNPEVSVCGVEPLPASYALEQNFPNPFNPETAIRYQLPTVSRVVLDVIDITGCEVDQLVNSEQTAGTYHMIWDGCNSRGSRVPSGIYFYRLRAGEFSAVRKMMLVR